jgi:hypothetical protein
VAIPIAIIVSGLIVGGALLIALRYEIAVSDQSQIIYRLDKWSGRIVVCVAPPAPFKQFDGAIDVPCADGGR